MPNPNTHHKNKVSIHYGFVFRPEHGRDKCSGFLHLWVGNTSSTRSTATPYDVDWEEWNFISGFDMESASPERRRVLAEYEERMNRDLRLVADIVREFKRRGRRFTPANVIETFKHRQDNGMSVEIFSLQEEYA